MGLFSNKRGEMTTEQIVVLIILIASFAVILFFLLKADLFGQSSDDICHNSVVARGNIDRISGTAADSIPLDCQRDYVCLTADKSCEEMQKPDLVKVKTKDDVYKALADEMADCWWMFGEGKIDYTGTDFVSNMYCSICDQVKFDDSVKEIFPNEEFDKKELYDYLSTHNISEDQTYAEYMFNTNNLVGLFGSEGFGTVNLNKSYYVLLGATSDISTLGWATVGAAVAAGGAVFTVVTGGTGWGVVGVVSVATSAGVGGVAAGTTAHFVAPVIEDYFGRPRIPPSLIEVGSKEYDALKCERISTKS